MQVSVPLTHNADVYTVSNFVFLYF